MPGICMPFGYYPETCDVNVGDVTIATLPGFEEKVTGIQKSPGVVDEWVYAPSEAGRQGRIFGLPSTHAITHENPDNIDRKSVV